MERKTDSKYQKKKKIKNYISSKTILKKKKEEIRIFPDKSKLNTSQLTDGPHKMLKGAFMAEIKEDKIQLSMKK